MGAAAGPVGAGAALASAGLTAAGGYMKAEGTKSADDAQAARLERAAEYGKVAADETDAQLRDRLNLSLGNIDAVRAAQNTDPSSPTTAALRAKTEFYGDQERGIRVGNILAQNEQDIADAAYMRNAGSYALTMGKVGVAASLLKAVATTASGTFGMPGGGPGAIPFAPDDI